MGGFNNKHLFLTVPEAGKSKIKVPVDSVSGKGSFPGFQMAAFLLYHHTAGRLQALVNSSADKGTNPIMGALPS